MDISNSYLNNNGSFYIKFNSTHTDENLRLSFKYAETLQKGYYIITKGVDSNWNMNTNPITDIAEIPPVDLSKNQIIVFFDGSTVKDSTIDSKKQMFRIVGESETSNDSPFIINNGKTILNPKWEPIVSCIYNTVVNTLDKSNNKLDDYQDFNPFLQKRLIGQWEKFLEERKQIRQNDNQSSK